MTATGPSGPHDRPQPDGSDIVKVGPEQRADVARALAEAFFDDPVGSWIYRNDKRRLRQLERGFDLYLRRLYLSLDECYTTNRVAGASLWMPPGTARVSMWRQLLLLGPSVVIAGRDTFRLLGVLTEMDRRHPKETHWYLPFIGVRQAWQGRGFGAALLRPILERCDAEKLPAYLEASSARNRALYERHGFEASGEPIVVKDSPPLQPMWREPQT